MKSKRRHELQTNQLADRLGHWIERVRPYTAMCLLLAAGAVLILAAWYFFASTQETKRAESWRSYMLAGTNPQIDLVKELNTVADQFDDTQAGQWAALTAADIESARGVRLMFSDRAAAETSLNLAKNRFGEVLKSKYAAKDAMLLRRSHFGLAQVYESQGELDNAKKQYATVAESGKENALGKAAQARVDRLETTATQKWYNWFANQKPAPRNLGTGKPGTSPLGLQGEGLNVLPDSAGADFMNDLVPDSSSAEAPASAGPPAPARTPASAVPPVPAGSETGGGAAPPSAESSPPAAPAPAETSPPAVPPSAETSPPAVPAPATPAEPKSDPPA